MRRSNPRKPQESTVAPAEVAQFDALAPHWWDEEGAMGPLHRMNPARLAFIRDALAAHFGGRPARLLAGLRILDLGCGGGLLSEPLARMGAQVTGVDASDAVLCVARDHARTQGLRIDYRQGSAESLIAAGKRFDVVCAMEIIEHVTEPEVFVARVAQLARPGGMIILSTLNRTLKSYALGILAAEYLLRWVPRGTHHWRQFVAPSELAGWLRQTGCRVTGLSGVVYDPLIKDFCLRDDKLGVNYLLAAARD